MWKLETTNMAWTRYEMSKYNPKVDGSIGPIYIWYRRAWTDQGVGVREALKNIWEGMLRWGK